MPPEVWLTGPVEGVAPVLQPAAHALLQTRAEVMAIAPGVLVIMRHHFCRMLFWVMTLGSILVWSVIFVVWITGHLHVSDKGQVGLSWLFAFSCLSAISFALVRTNDAFDYDVGVWLGRE